jgi:hypothetical protein
MAASWRSPPGFSWSRDVWHQWPLTGAGPGYIYPPVSGRGGGSLGLDSPLLLLSKFGLIGTAGLAIAFLLLVTAFRNVRKAAGYDVTGTASAGFLLVIIALLPFGTPLEDKGTALACLLLVAVLTARAKAAQRRPAVECLPHDRGTGDLHGDRDAALKEAARHAS